MYLGWYRDISFYLPAGGTNIVGEYSAKFGSTPGQLNAAATALQILRERTPCLDEGLTDLRWSVI